MAISSRRGQRVVIVGSGVGGLASAALLAKEGFDVTVLEKNEQPGGRASVLEKDGFLFDMGPSWYLMPDAYERFFQAMGTTTSAYLRLHHLSPHYRIFLPDGNHTQIDLSADLAENRALFERIEPGAGAQLDRLLAAAKTKYDLSMDHILYRNIDTVFQFASKDLRDKGRQLQVFESMQHYVRRFFKSPVLQNIILYALLNLGSTPSKAPALYSLMAHVEFNLGVWYPEGGIVAVIQALVALGEKYGVRYVYDSPVTRLEVAAGRVVTVHCGTKAYPADLVVSNADYAHTEALLSNTGYRQYDDKYWRTRTLAPSAFILYLGVRGQIPELVHHNLLFTTDWDRYFAELVDRPAWPRQPYAYICVPSKTDPTVAPAGDENLFVLVPIAAKLTETEESRQEYASFVLNYVEKATRISIQDRLIVKEIFSVSDFASRYNSLGGSALGLAHTMRQSTILRPPNKSRRLPNLFFVGANTNPGIGVPMCLISAHLVRDRILGVKG